MTDPTPEGGRRSRPRWLAWAGFALGLGLLAGAVWVLFRQPQTVDDLRARLSDAPWWAVGFLLLSPLLNWSLVSTSMWMLLRRHGRLGLGEMHALVGSAWLLNHLPLRPGLVGRVGYHKMVNGIRVRDAVEATFWSLGLAGVAGLMALGLALAAPGGVGLPTAGAMLAGPVVVVGGFALLARAVGRTGSAWMLGALAVRYADMGAWAARYAVGFWVMGLEPAPMDILAVTAVSQVAQLIPTFGGGLGIREWFVGLVAGGMGLDFDSALAADLINRAAETLMVLPVGLVCGTLVARRLSRFRRAQPDGMAGAGAVAPGARGGGA